MNYKNKQLDNGNNICEDDKMKKILKFILPYLIIFVLLGCELNNTPTSKVEERLSNYQMISNNININDKVQLLTDGDNLTESQIGEYKSIIEKQYKNLAYNVKDETLDGESAVVEVQIEVADFKSAIEELNREVDKNVVGVEQYNESKIEKLKEIKDKVTYTIEFSVSKDINGNWNLEELDSTEEQKLLGIY